MLSITRSKINLGLDIIAKRPDGYHDIATVMYPIKWGDVLEITPNQGQTMFIMSGRELACAPDDNIVLKAYRALAQKCELPGVDIHLHKIVPDGAGLGGGSADAAYALSMLRDLFALNLNDKELEQIAASLGADCPYFLYQSPMLATGIGTTLTPVDVNLSSYKLIVVKPPVSVPTAKAYAGVRPYEPSEPLVKRLQAPVEMWRDLITNRFEESVIPQYPIIGDIKDELYAAGAIYASMSGSGSAVYGIFPLDANPTLPPAWDKAPWSKYSD